MPLTLTEKAFGMPADEALNKWLTLTARERDVANKLAEDLKTSSIASILGVSVKTLDIHRSNIRRKFEVSTTAGIVKVVILARLAPKRQIA